MFENEESGVFMKSLLKLGSLLVAPAILMSACGDTQLGQRLSLKLDAEKQTANLEVEMSQGLELALSGSFGFPKEYGSLYFVPASKTTNAKIGVAVNVAKIVADQAHIDIGNVSTLPNGAPLPVAMTAPLLSLPVYKNNDFDVKGLLALSPDLQIGTLVGLKVFNSKYIIPGFAVCQNFRNSEQVAVAAICIYGPNASGTEWGGIMVGGNLGQVLPQSGSSASVQAVASKSFMMRTASASELSLNPFEVQSVDFVNSIYDPAKELNGSKGLKTYRNIQKVLQVRK